MIQLLKFIVTYLASLFDEYNFQIKEANNAGNRFSGASILMASDEVEIFLAIERDEITADFHSVFDKRKRNWYSVDIIFNLLGYKNVSGVLDDRSSPLLRDELKKIIDRFHKSEIEETLKLMDRIKKERSKRM